MQDVPTTIIYDSETGKVKSPYEQKKEKCLENIATLIDKLNLEKDLNLRMKKPQPLKFGYRLAAKVTAYLRSYPPLTKEEQSMLTVADIRECQKQYMDLVAIINESFDFSANKQDFCALLGITVRDFNNLGKDGRDEEMTLLKDNINDYLNGMGFHAAENGNLNDKSVLTRLQTKEAGQDQVKNELSVNINLPNDGQTPNDLLRQFNCIDKQIVDSTTKKKIKKRE